jgi:hypothetical protein
VLEKKSIDRRRSLDVDFVGDAKKNDRLTRESRQSVDDSITLPQEEDIFKQYDLLLRCYNNVSEAAASTECSAKSILKLCSAETSSSTFCHIMNGNIKY